MSTASLIVVFILFPQNQAIRYLSYVVNTFGNTDPAIHNYLLTLYATQPAKDETALLVFLKNEVIIIVQGDRYRDAC